MPITGLPILPKIPTSPMKSKKMKISSDERLKLSKKKFNLSKKRVENLKRICSVKRLRPIEKPGENDWVTSGKIGSRDAVLVFRTRILLSNRILSPKSSKTSLTSNNEQDNENDDEINDNNENSENNENIDNLEQSKGAIRKSTTSINSDVILIKSNQSLRSQNKENITQTTLSREDSFLENELNEIDNKINKTLGNKKLNEIKKNNEQPIHNEEVSSNAGYEKLKNNKSNSDSSLNNRIIDNGNKENCANTNELLENLEENNDNIPDYDIPYAETMPALQMKISFKFMQTETKLLRKIFIRHGLAEITDESEDFTILWTGIHMKPDILRNLLPFQRVNHFPRSYELTRKDRLYKNIENLQYMRGFKNFDFMPQSFLLPMEYRDLVTAHNKCRGPWIAKPTASSRGRGIFIVNSPDQIPQEDQVLVSKYITEPLCIDGHKCDVRVYVLVTSFDPLIIYLYEEGLVRLATVKYDPKVDNLWNPCMHLCNYSINKYHSDYVKSNNAQNDDIGHKWTLSALLRHLKTQGCNTDELMSNIEDLVIKSIFSCSQTIISACRMFMPSMNNCFELYGFDILIDDALKPWLLEINLSPSMGVDSPIDTKVKACLITDLLTCVGIPAFSAHQRKQSVLKGTRFRAGDILKRLNSADCANTSNISTSSINHKRLGCSSATNITFLNPEEQRIVRNSRMQYARRGRFVRIFPTRDSMQRYGSYLDSQTGIPLSTSMSQSGQYSLNSPRNYNQMLFTALFGKEAQNGGYSNDLDEECSWDCRIYQYERPLDSESSTVTFRNKKLESKCEEESQRLRKYILKLIGNGAELTQLQARQMFSFYLERVLRRLAQETRDSHENYILKFLNRIGGTVKAPVVFRSSSKFHPCNKSKTAVVAKLLGEFLEQYNRETDTYVDSFDHFGMIPRVTFHEFLSQAQEADLEQVLAIHTNVTGAMPYLYNRYGTSIPPTPPIPSGTFGFLKSLPAMVVRGAGARDFNRSDLYYNKEKEYNNIVIGSRNGNAPVRATTNRRNLA